MFDSLLLIIFIKSCIMKVVALAKIIGTFILLAFVNTQQIVNKIIDDNNVKINKIRFKNNQNKQQS